MKSSRSRLTALAGAALLLSSVLSAPAAAEGYRRVFPGFDPSAALQMAQQRLQQQSRSVVGADVPQVQRPSAFSPQASWQVCFTPGNDCTGAIVAAIREARSQILVMAYEFTSDPIQNALLEAKMKRGIDVRVIFDKSQLSPKRSSASLFDLAHIPVLIDNQPAIAHNKVMVIDGKDVITGSFNFTLSAQTRNSENVLFLRNAPELAREYGRNWEARAKASQVYGR